MDPRLYSHKLWATISVWFSMTLIMIVFLNKVRIHPRDALAMGLGLIIVLSVFACVTSMLIWFSDKKSS